MSPFCKLCGGTFNFSKLQITKSYDGTIICLSSHINRLKEDEKFRFCPLCGEKLSDENFQDVKFQ